MNLIFENIARSFRIKEAENFKLGPPLYYLGCSILCHPLFRFVCFFIFCPTVPFVSSFYSTILFVSMKFPNFRSSQINILEKGSGMGESMKAGEREIFDLRKLALIATRIRLIPASITDAITIIPAAVLMISTAFSK